ADLGHAAGEAENIHGRESLDIRVVTELAITIPAPTLDAAAGHKRTRVCIPRPDLDGAACESRHIHGNRAGAGRAVAELAPNIQAPALDAAAGCKRTRVETPGTDLGIPVAHRTYR